VADIPGDNPFAWRRLPRARALNRPFTFPSPSSLLALVDGAGVTDAALPRLPDLRREIISKE